MYVSRTVYHSLRAIAKARSCTADELADTWLMERLGNEAGPILELYRRHEKEEREALEKMNETNQ